MSETGDNSAPDLGVEDTNAKDIDQQIAPFLPPTSQDRRPGTPNVVIDISLPSKLTEDSECVLTAKIRRSPDDGHEQPCVVYWSPEPRCFGAGAFVLLRYTESGLQQVEMREDGLEMMAEPGVRGVGGYSAWELAAGSEKGGGLEFAVRLDDRYLREMVTGEKYELVWPGGEIKLWEWGGKEELPSGKVGVKYPYILVPPARVTLEIEEDEEVRWIFRPPLEPSARIPGAPVLTATMECATTLALGSSIHIKLRVVYEAPPGSPPITVHSYWIDGDTMLYHRRGGKWREVPYDRCCLGVFWDDDPDMEVNVSQQGDFTSLEAGEALTEEYNVDPTEMEEMPRDVVVGDVFRYRYLGTEMDWWDWGGKKEHAETTVQVPSFISGGVIEPSDNNGRPKLVIPASDAVEFTIV